MGSIRACYGWESFPIPGAEIFSFRHSGPCNIEIRNRHIHIQLCTTIAKSRRIFVERFAGDAGIVVFILSRGSRLTHTGRRTFGVGQRRPMQRIIRQRHLHRVGQAQRLCFLRDCSYGQRDRCHRGQQLKYQVDALWTRSSGSYFQGCSTPTIPKVVSICAPLASSIALTEQYFDSERRMALCSASSETSTPVTMWCTLTAINTLGSSVLWSGLDAHLVAGDFLPLLAQDADHVKGSAAGQSNCDQFNAASSDVLMCAA